MNGNKILFVLCGLTLVVVLVLFLISPLSIRFNVLFHNRLNEMSWFFILCFAVYISASEMSRIIKKEKGEY